MRTLIVILFLSFLIGCTGKRMDTTFYKKATVTVASTCTSITIGKSTFVETRSDNTRQEKSSKNSLFSPMALFKTVRVW